MMFNKTHILGRLAALVLISSLGTAQAASLDFSSARVVPEASGPGKLRLEEVKHGNPTQAYQLDYVVGENYELRYQLQLADGQLQATATLPEFPRQWEGVYQVGNCAYPSLLKIAPLNATLWQGSVTHQAPAGQEAACGAFSARLAGEVITQYQTPQGVWLDGDRLDTRLTPQSSTPKRSLLRLQRIAAQQSSGPAGTWSAQREYRLVVDAQGFSGQVSVPLSFGGESAGAIEGTGGALLSAR